MNEAPDNRRELTEERRDHLVVRTFWLKLTNEIELELTDENSDEVHSLIIPHDKINEARTHPFVYLNNQVRLQKLSTGGEV